MQHQIAGAKAPFDIVWDSLGVAHVYADSVADAYRGMGYAAGSERLWQIHLSVAFAKGEAAALLGERWVAQDALQRACNVHGGYTTQPDSEGDWIVDAYLEGLNSWVQGLAEVPAEFVHAETEPRLFTRADVAARYRFTSWFQHKSFTEKMLLGRLMATHGTEVLRDHVLHFSAADADLIEELQEPLKKLDMTAMRLAYPEIMGNEVAAAALTQLSGSNNWAVTGALSASGKPMLATDPHQPHAIPNTFFYVHLHAPGWDAFGAAFPGVPYFMMGYTRDIAWGLTTGFVDTYDIYVEQLRDGTNGAPGQHRTPDGWQALGQRSESIAIKGGGVREVPVTRTSNGVLLEPLLHSLGLSAEPPPSAQWQTALHWSLDQVPTSAGALAQLPLAKTARQFGELLFEDDVCPLVNNIICVDTNNNLERYVAATLPARGGPSRAGPTGSVPLAGWRADCQFERSVAADLVVEVNPKRSFSFTANNDTMGERGPYYIHNFPISSARADRIEELLTDRENFTSADFTAMQLDLKDLRAVELVPLLLAQLTDAHAPDLLTARDLLADWDCCATADSAAACVYYLFLSEFWQREFLEEVFDEPLFRLLPLGAPGLNLFDLPQFLAPGSSWHDHADALREHVRAALSRAMSKATAELGADLNNWQYGALQQVAFQHSLARFPHWQAMRVGPDPLGGSATTLAMAMHILAPDLGSGTGSPTRPPEVPAARVYHGPAYRLVVDLADPDHAEFVIAGGNGGRADSPFVNNQYPAWQLGNYFTLSLVREELDVAYEWRCGNGLG